MRLLAGLLFFFALAPAAASAQLYAFGWGGVGFQSRELGAGPNAGGGIGYELPLPIAGRLRLELEGAYRNHAEGKLVALPEGATEIGPGVYFFDSPLPPDTEPSYYERVRIKSAMVNLAYVSPTFADRLSVYVGGGIGASRVAWRIQEFQGIEIVDAIFIGVFSDSEQRLTMLSWQAMGGVSADVTRWVQVYVEGRYMRAGDSETFESSTLVAERSLRFSNTSALAGVRIMFN